MLLVTGASGYIGSALVALLHARGRPARAMVRARVRASALPDGVPWMVADLDDPAALRRAVDGCTAVFHLAGTVGGDPETVRRLAVDGTRAVLGAAVEAGVRRFVHAGTGAAVVDAEGLVSERPVAPPALTDPYSRAKAEADRLVLAQGARNPSGSGPSVVVAAPGSVYGPSPAGPRSYTALLVAAARGEVTEIVDAEVGWVLAEDVAAGLLLVHDRGQSGRRYLLVGEVGGFGWTLNRYAELVGSPHRVRPLPPGSAAGPDASAFARRAQVWGELGRLRIDDAGARALGFAPTGLAEGLARTARWLSGPG